MLVFLGIGLVLKVGAGLLYPQAFVRIATFTRVDSIGIGFLCYLLLDRWRLWHFAVLAAICIVVTAIHERIHNAATVIAFMYASNFCFGVLCALLYRFERARPCSNTIFRNVSTFIGSSSYSIYVLHLSILTIAMQSGIGLVPYVALVILCSHATHIYFELPLMRMRPNYKTASELRP
jgi:peptidoglycan/LPS O-acetylase OafA/YrhL